MSFSPPPTHGLWDVLLHCWGAHGRSVPCSHCEECSAQPLAAAKTTRVPSSPCPLPPQGKQPVPACQPGRY